MSKSISTFAAVLAFAAPLAFQPVHADDAQFKVTNPSQILTGFDVNQVADIAREIGYEAKVVDYQDGTRGVRIKTSTGSFFYASPVVCDVLNPQTGKAEQGPCTGLDISTNFGPSASVPAGALNYFNSYRVFTKALSQDGQVILARYEIANYGIPKGNVAINLFAFTEVAGEFGNFVKSANGGNAPGTSFGDPLKTPVGGTSPDVVVGAISARDPVSGLSPDRFTKRGPLKAWSEPAKPAPAKSLQMQMPIAPAR